MAQFVAQFVVRDRRFSATNMKGWHVIAEIDWKMIPLNVKQHQNPLTQKSINHWKSTKSPVGYASFRGLTKTDILSICYATRQGKATLSVNRMGKTAFYKLLKQ